MNGSFEAALTALRRGERVYRTSVGFAFANQLVGTYSNGGSDFTGINKNSIAYVPVLADLIAMDWQIVR